MNKEIIVVEESNAADFENVCNNLIDDGYKILTSNCGFFNSETYEFKSLFQAILQRAETEK